MNSFGRRSRRTRRSRRGSKRRSRRRRSRRSRVGRPTDMKKYRPERGCTKLSDKKYRSRPGPAYPANLCRGQKMPGNDGKIYVSARASNKGKAYYRWKKI